MGQQDILDLLKERKGWILSKEILKITSMSDGALFRLLRILEKNNEIIKKRAIEVIKNKTRLGKSPKHAWAYKIPRLNRKRK